ncbi:MAG: hypothetical protein ACRBBR_14510 [Cellvibrionaceae bacterium]
MEADLELTVDQKERIEATLQRIRNGLKIEQANVFEEPAHTFNAEVFNASEK